MYDGAIVLNVCNNHIKKNTMQSILMKVGKNNIEIGRFYLNP
jgi:hypothetical protein